MSDAGKTEKLGKEATDAKAAVEHGVSIRDATRNITLKALSQGQIDTEGTKKVVRSVMQGASLGVNKAGDKSRQALTEALAGIDDALAKSAEATKLAVEEASGRLKDYSKRDLERSFNDLRALEEMLLDTIKDVADHAAGETREILHGLIQHARNSGTNAGATATAAITSLEKKLGSTLREVAAAGADAAMNTGSNLAEAAAGFLAGIAETLHGKANNMRSDKK